jgi:APA family basic amino acid/polyamine antiporter
MKRELGLFDAVMMGLSGAIGFEIFVLMDYAYFHLAGSGMILALLLGGLTNLLIMFSYCELGAAIPEIGGEYTYTKAAYGGLVAFISGCLRWLASVFGAALAALTFVHQLLYLFSKFAPAVEGFVSAQMPLIAIIVVMVLAALQVRGVKKVGIIMVAVFLAIFAIFLAGGLWHGLIPPEILPKPLSEGLPGVFAATAYTFPMFFGMRALVAGAAQIKDPEKNVPRAILLSALLIMPLYFSVAYVAVGVSPGGDGPLLNLAAEEIMGVAGGVLFAIAGMVASLSALGTSITVQSSIARGMSRDGYLPKTLLSVHRRFGTPYVAIIAGSLFIMLLSVTRALEFLGYAASFGSILVFALVNLSLLKLRKKKPHMKKPFKTPLYPITPIAGIVMSLVLLAFPMFLRDVNAINALMSGLGLMALVLITYHLRMVGRYRLKVAVGGISLGTGIFMALLTFLIETGFVLLTLPRIILIFVSAVSILAGILNVSTRKVF